MTSDSRLQVAIIGAGIAGLTSAIALLKHPLIDVTIYEKASELKAVGASIALGPNGLRTLERLGLHDAISDEIAFRGPSGLPMIYRHWKTNEVIGKDEHVRVTEHSHRTARYHRAHLQKALVDRVPLGLVKLGRKLVDVRVREESVQLRFEDGQEIGVDVVLGADGLHSVS